MPEIDQSNIKDGWIQTITLGASSWGNYFRVSGMIILALVVGMSGWLAYSGDLAFMIRSAKYRSDVPSLREDAYDTVARSLQKELSPDIIVFAKMEWSESGERVVQRVYMRDGSRNAMLEGFRGKIFEAGNEQQEKFMSALSAGRVPCDEINKKDDRGYKNALQSFYQRIGIKYRCGVSIPPDPSVFSGYISVGWVDKDYAQSIEGLSGVLVMASEQLTKRPK